MVIPDMVDQERVVTQATAVLGTAVTQGTAVKVNLVIQDILDMGDPGRVATQDLVVLLGSAVPVGVIVDTPASPVLQDIPDPPGTPVTQDPPGTPGTPDPQGIQDIQEVVSRGIVVTLGRVASPGFQDFLATVARLDTQDIVAILDLGRVATPDIQDLGLQGIVDSLDPAAIQDFLVHQGIPGQVLQAIQVTPDNRVILGTLDSLDRQAILVLRDIQDSQDLLDIADIQEVV